MSIANWRCYNEWSGISIHGNNEFVCPNPAEEWDVVIAAIAKPEGHYDTVVSYDGTALTWGLAQWTFTSGRLQRLLGEIITRLGFDSPLLEPAITAIRSAGLILSPNGSLLDLNSKPVVGKSDLRCRLTPVGGVVPRSGKNWEIAARIAEAFHALGKDPTVAKIQTSFLVKELRHESTLKRPTLCGSTIARYLYEGLNIGGTPELIVARSLFWSMWQNSPRASEGHLFRALSAPIAINQRELGRIASVYAKSPFGYWGNRHCAELKDKNGNPTPRESRYHKVASEINRVMGFQILDPDIK